MLIKILIYGGLGNQLFQFAFGESLKITYKNLEVKYIDLTKFAPTKRMWELGFLKINPQRISKREIITIFFRRIINAQLNKFSSKFLYFGIINDNQYEYIHEYLNKGRSFIIDGYWQSEEYFLKHKVDIKNILNINSKPLSNKEKRKFKKVAVHIRLGDYINSKQGRDNHLVCDINWYKKAINHLKDYDRELLFTIFSDNKELVKNQFKNYSNLEINQSDYSKNAYEDLYEMATFDHFIISNSSYSWWASYLGEKKNSIIIAPKYWFKDKKTEEISLFRKNWTLL